MDDQKQQEERWRELAELLGLSDDAPPAARKETPAPPAPPMPEAPAIKAYEEPRSIAEHAARIEDETPRPPIHDEQDAPTIPMLRHEPVMDWESEFEDEDDTPLEEPEEAGAAETEAAGEDHAAEPAAAAEEGKPRRGRRRRRRGRRRGGADKTDGEGQPSRPPAQESTAAPASRPARNAEQESRDRRGRRGGKGRDDEEPRPPSPPTHERQESPIPVEADDFQDEKPSAADAIEARDTDADFSDWNVPSWQDLISSLYRPER
jgi:hypothetical protein